MKKLLLIAAVAVFGFTATAQAEFRVGINGGIPVGDADLFSSFAGTLDVDYDWEVSETFTVGAATGLGYYFGKDGGDGFKYLPIVASADVNISDEVSAGANVGYAVSLETNGGGDFTWRIQVRYEISENVDVQGVYDNISGNGITFSFAGVGVGFKF